MNLSVSNSPFDQEQAAQLNQIFQTLTAEQQIWLTGYLTAQQGSVTQTAEAPQQVAEYVLNNESESQTNNNRHITVVYGSETGNAQSLAEIFADRLVEHNYTVKLTAMDEIKQKEFKKVEDLFVITATHGEGDPPDNALTFHEFIHSRKAPKLENVRFSVLALGDESYEYFCQTGKDFDAKLLELGAERLADRQDCDLDFDDFFLVSFFSEFSESVVSVFETSTSFLDLLDLFSTFSSKCFCIVCSSSSIFGIFLTILIISLSLIDLNNNILSIPPICGFFSLICL